MLDKIKIINWDESEGYNIYLVIDTYSESIAKDTVLEFFHQFIPSTSGEFLDESNQSQIIVNDSSVLSNVYIYSGNDAPTEMLLDPNYNGKINLFNPIICHFRLDPKLSMDNVKRVYDYLKSKCTHLHKLLIISE